MAGILLCAGRDGHDFRGLTGETHRMRLLVPGLAVLLSACSVTQRPDELELTYYYLDF
jgi:hypothetical protein